MALPFLPDFPFSLQVTTSTTMNIRTAQFGDGYIQEVGDGLNSVFDVWQLSWEGLTLTNAILLNGFFTRLAGVRAFFWQPPNETTPRVFTCPRHSGVIPVEGVKTFLLTANFTEEFDLITIPLTESEP